MQSKILFTTITQPLCLKFPDNLPDIFIKPLFMPRAIQHQSAHLGEDFFGLASLLDECGYDGTCISASYTKMNTAQSLFY
jgi:hypothetical protein